MQIRSFLLASKIFPIQIWSERRISLGVSYWSISFFPNLGDFNPPTQSQIHYDMQFFKLQGFIQHGWWPGNFYPPIDPLCISRNFEVIFPFKISDRHLWITLSLWHVVLKWVSGLEFSLQTEMCAPSSIWTILHFHLSLVCEFHLSKTISLNLMNN